MIDKQKFNNGILIFGKHSVISAIKAKQRNIYSIMVLKQNFNDTALLLKEIAPNLLPKLQIVKKEILDDITKSEDVHQGYIMHCSKIKTLDFNDLIALSNSTTNYKVVILDNVTDTRNIGSVMRSAVAFNIDAIILLKNTYLETSAMVKASSGAIEHIKIVTIANLANTINVLKQNNFWTIGLSANTHTMLSELDSFNKTAIILGSEGFGMKKLTIENCDFIAKIDINTNYIDSLNISNAAAIAFYEISKK